MNLLDPSRWQFGITTIYHFLFVPIAIGLVFLVAGFQTAWFRTGDDRWLKLTKFYGKLFLIDFAMGVVTGIVQEFQFGMNWPAYSRFVGDIFGAPLAIEALLAFFLESTFLGLWIFGWDRLSRRVHLATIWIVAFGTAASRSAEPTSPRSRATRSGGSSACAHRTRTFSIPRSRKISGWPARAPAMRS